MKMPLCVYIIAGLLNIVSIVQAKEGSMMITSPSFAHHAMIPRKYTCQGEDVNPPLKIADLPPGTQSLVLINDDPDAPGGTWDHWIVYNIPPMGMIEENFVPGVQGFALVQRRVAQAMSS
jgi:phosphatidylethanolamine-binding protein (PEBP) family uncharacterized protein